MGVSGFGTNQRQRDEDRNCLRRLPARQGRSLRVYNHQGAHRELSPHWTPRLAYSFVFRFLVLEQGTVFCICLLFLHTGAGPLRIRG
jgi:hypothetical protein